MKVKFEKNQLHAIKHGRGPLLIIAGAGTGKTTVITERIKYLALKKKVPVSSILALTFTEKASLEMEERVDKVMPYGYTQMWISTFHSFCDRVLKQEAIHIGLSSSFKIMTEPESIIFLRKNLFKFNLRYFRPLGNPNKFLEGLVQHFSRLKDEDVSPIEYLQWAQNKKSRPKDDRPLAENKEEIEKTLELAKAYQLYEDLKVKEAVFDFSDLISNTLKLFRGRSNILAEYQNRFQYILVDEFQDTNYAQNELAILLAGKKQNINVVGDDDQAIYRWRGAAISNILQFKKHFPKTKIVVLTKNFRSTQEILDKSYKLIQNNNPDRLEVREKISKKLIAEREIKGDPIEFIFTDRVENEAEEVIEKIKELIKKKGYNYKRKFASYAYKDFSILVRANNHAEPFIRAFERHKIPYQFLGPGQLFRQDEIKDLIAYLKVLYNFEDSVSLYRVLSMNHFGIPPRDLAAILNFGRRQSLCLFEAIEKIDEITVSENAKKKIKDILGMINRHLKRIREDTAGQIIYYFLRDSKLLDTFTSYKTAGEERRVQNIAKFFDKLKTYEVEHQDASVPAIVEWIDLSMQMGESPQAATIDWTASNAVNILTIHSSKGLEFPVVFLVNLVNGRFPTRERSEQIPLPEDIIKEILPVGDYHLQEERRLFYVGMTRARNHLFFTASNYYGEGKRERKLSPFVYEALGENVKDTVLKITEPNGQLTLLEWGGLSESEGAESPSATSSPATPITYLSYSQIQTFDVCPLHYKLKYILKIPTPQTGAQSFGTSIHSTLRDFYQSYLKGEKLKVSHALSILEKNWINEGFLSRAHEKKFFEKAKGIIEDFVKNNFDKDNLPIALELPFRFALGNLKIGGRIDRIDNIGGNRIEIIDYKTGSNTFDEKKLASDPQLNVYALAATEVHDKILHKKPEEVVLSLYFLESNKKLTTTRTPEQLKEAKKSILQKADEISKSKFLCSGSALCVNCEYKMLCSSKG